MTVLRCMIVAGISGAQLLGQAVPTQSNLALVRDAAQAIAAGDLRRAETELQVVLRSEPSEYRASNLLGVIRAQQRREAEAEQLFKQAIQSKPDFASAHVDLGLLYIQTNRSDDAVFQLQEALRLDPDRADARDALVGVWRVQARRSVQKQNFEQAISLLSQARKLNPRNPDVLFDFGMVVLRMALFSDAAQAFEEALALRKDDSKAMYGLGRAQIGLAKFQEAQQTFQDYVRLRPTDASGCYALGFVLESLQQTAEARRQFEKSIELQPGQTESYFQLGLMDLDENLSSASGRFARVLERDPKHAGALTGMGRVEFEQKNYQQAAELLHRAIAADSSVRQAHYYLGMAYGRMGQKDDSERELQIATQLEDAEVAGHQAGLRLLNPQEEPGTVQVDGSRQNK